MTVGQHAANADEHHKFRNFVVIIRNLHSSFVLPGLNGYQTEHG